MAGADRLRRLLGVFALVLIGTAGLLVPLLDNARGAAQARNDSTHSDPAGDSGTAPDITQVVVSHSGTQITFRIVTPGTPTLPSDVTVFVAVDSDQSRSTGSPTFLGADFMLAARGSDHSLWIERWNGTAWDPWQPTGRPFTEAAGVTISINNSSLKSTTAFRFWASADKQQSGGTGVHTDWAPDSGTWEYLFVGGTATTSSPATTAPAPKPAAATIKTFRIQPRPAAPVAGASFTVSVPVVVWSTGKTGKPDAVNCIIKLAGVPLRGIVAGGCTVVLPKTAAGKKLTVRVTARCGLVMKTRTLSYTVRAASTTPPKPAPTPKPPSGGTSTAATISVTPAAPRAGSEVTATIQFPPGPARSCLLVTPFGNPLLMIAFGTSANQAKQLVGLRVGPAGRHTLELACADGGKWAGGGVHATIRGTAYTPEQLEALLGGPIKLRASLVLVVGA